MRNNIDEIPYKYFKADPDLNCSIIDCRFYSDGTAIYQGYDLQLSGPDGRKAYNDFEPFIPFVPGYFPEDFDLTHVGHGESRSNGLNIYTEIYATDTHFFKTIQQQGKDIPSSIAESDFTIQGMPATIDETLPGDWLRDNEIDQTRFDLSQGWVVTRILKEIQIQVVTNLPQNEAILIAEGLVPAICTSKPTATP